MNSILNDVEELKKLVLESEEYKNYKTSLDILDSNNDVKELINKITNLQKNIVKKMSKKEDVKIQNKELDKLYDELNSIEEYTKYIDNSKKLNVLITNIQKEFEKYFNNLVS